MKRKILLVEDNPATIDVIQKELEFLGYESVVAEDGKEGVEKASSYLPDLIIMDISLPKLDGLEASIAIRKNPRMGGDLFRTMKYQSFTPAPLPDFLLIQRDQRQEMRLAVADDHSLTDPRVRFQKILNCLRRNLLSA